MRVGFLGAQGTGKSTIFKALRDENYGSFEFIGETAREFKHLGLNKDGNSDVQQLIFNNSLKSMLMHENFISDRTIIDPMIYTWYQRDIGKCDEYVFEYQYESAVRMSRRYDLLFYFPIEFPVVADECRIADEDYRSAIDRKFREFLDSYRVPVLEVCGNVEDRLKFIKHKIESKKLEGVI